MENINLQGDYKLEARVENRDSKKGIIIAHSFRNSMDELACSDAEQLFYKNGFTTLSFNFLGHIQRNFLLRKNSTRN